MKRMSLELVQSKTLMKGAQNKMAASAIDFGIITDSLTSTWGSFAPTIGSAAGVIVGAVALTHAALKWGPALVKKIFAK